VKYIELAMIRHHLDALPHVPCPDGYTLRTFRPGDEQAWARILALVEEFRDEDQALAHFSREFGPYSQELGSRCFFLATADGAAIGTATAWYGSFAGEERGRVHWVAIEPRFQGRGLAKPLLGAVMARLAVEHRTAYLTTQTTSYRAINLYLAFGFVPHLLAPSCEEGWRLMEAVLRRPILPVA
jgi:GNAT superfamily N-acetyltransferase